MKFPSGAAREEKKKGVGGVVVVVVVVGGGAEEVTKEQRTTWHKLEINRLAFLSLVVVLSSVTFCWKRR